MTLALTLFSGQLTADPVRFIIGFILACCAIAIVIILARWLAGLAGFAIPGPLMLVLGILVFMLLMLWVLSWAGIYHF